MNHPYGRCQNCGERLYEHVEGGYQCLNCDSRYPEDELEAPLVDGA
ncbi:hypothetical protein [Salinadaptatus halalkaliphilus]|nr:hypothetical protein [Salinadaptatus halalkaliphilus]